jgi:hypothetical protein
MSDMETSGGLSCAFLSQAFADQPLFAEKTWRLSPEAFPLTAQQVKEIESIGRACVAFQRAVDVLYTKSRNGKNLLRNEELLAPWAAGYLDRGKPQPLIDHGMHESVVGGMPFVLRPDLLMTEDGFALTELDSIPGGIGLTAFLNRLYESDETVGSADKMLKAFYNGLAAQRPDLGLPFIAILVSEEAATYRPEMEWIATQLQREGRRVFVFAPEDVMPIGNSLCVDIDGNPEKIDIIYRFFELFDLPNIPEAQYIQKVVETDHVKLTPPMRHFQEEKLNLGLFHHHRLAAFWQESMDRRSNRVFQKIVPRTWIMDHHDLPPGAVLDAPWVGGKPIHDWGQLVNASQKERNLILKISGYHETAWGARSVILGSDSSRVQWGHAIHQALRMSGDNLHILQEYHKPARIEHPVFTPDGDLSSMQGRVRLCPYFFVQGDTVELTGILATICPSDKKIIHGMKDAILLPCRVFD